MPEILTPPILRGDEKQQLVQLRDYLVYVSKQFDIALDQMDRNVQTVVSSSNAVSGATQKAISQQTDTLRQMIVNNATVVRSEIDRIETKLTDSFSAESDYGKFKSRTETRLDAHGSSIDQYLTDISEINDGLDELGNKLESVSRTEGYIRYGVVIPSDGVNPAQFGIAIGQNLHWTTMTDGEGNKYDVIDQTEFRTILTAKKLSFYQGENEVAYISNNQLCITAAEITGELTLGPWQISHNGGFSIKWIGTGG